MNAGLRLTISFSILAATSAIAAAQGTADAKRDPCAPLKRTDAPPGQLIHVVLNRPYSAVMETEFSRTLEDGTRIDRKGIDVHEYRDSAGRTRTEHAAIPMMGNLINPPDGPTMVMINDPVALKSYTLRPQNQTAQVREAPELAARTVAKKDSTEFQRVLPLDTDRPRPEFVTEDLGTQTIDGLDVVGTKETTTYPAGFEGNDRPFSSTRERWCSVDLRVIILQKLDDPRSGQTTIRLTNIERTEPDPSVFSVPPEYTITPMTSQPLGGPNEVGRHPVPIQH